MLLVLNTGSSSIKLAVFGPDLSEVLRGDIAGLGGGDNAAELTLGGATHEIAAETHREGLAALFKALPGAGLDKAALTGAAHRVVHGGDRLTAPVRIDAPTIATIRAMVPLAPLHNPPALAGIEAMAELLPDLPQFASFDTAFHASQPELATAYALPAEWRAKGIRRYGFHGLSYAGMVHQFGADIPERLLAMHLGAGVSLAAIKGGQSLATTMGYSPLSGPTMATRTGDIDGMAVLRMAEEVGVDEAGRILNKESGLMGLSGQTPDMRALLASDRAEDAFAVDHFVWTVVREAGALIAAMGGVDAVAFTGGIGENSAEVRGRIMERLSWLGDLPMHIVEAQEELQIARDAYGQMG